MNEITHTNLLRRLFQGAKLKSIPRGQVLQSSENEHSISLLMSGFVKRYSIANSGCLGIRAVYQRGDVFPLTAIIKALFNQDIQCGSEVSYYETMTSARLFTLQTSKILQKIQASPQIYKDILQFTSTRFYSNIQFLENIGLHGAYSKTARQLVYFAQYFGANTPQGTRVNLPLTHQDIADIIGTTRETVTMNIIKLRQKKIIKTGRNIFILDMKQLMAEAYA